MLPCFAATLPTACIHPSIHPASSGCCPAPIWNAWSIFNLHVNGRKNISPVSSCGSFSCSCCFCRCCCLFTRVIVVALPHSLKLPRLLFLYHAHVNYPWIILTFLSFIVNYFLINLVFPFSFLIYSSQNFRLIPASPFDKPHEFPPSQFQCTCLLLAFHLKFGKTLPCVDVSVCVCVCEQIAIENNRKQ